MSSGIGAGLRYPQARRNDGELAVARRQVEVVTDCHTHRCSQKYGRAGSPTTERQSSAGCLTSGVHANFHHALPDRAAVAVAREVANGVEHLVLKSNFDRIFDIKFVNRCVQFAALLNDCGEVLVQPADDFIDLSIRNLRSQTSHQSFDVLRPAAQGKVANSSQGFVHTID